jgi:hypothetical protein
MASQEKKLERAVKQARRAMQRARKAIPQIVERLKKGLKGKGSKPAISAVQRIRKYRADALRNRITRLKKWRAEHPKGFEPYMLNGHPGNVTQDIKNFIYRAYKAGLYVTSTTGGTHASTSWHYHGRAVDVAGAYSKMVAFQNAEANRSPHSFLELFGPDSFYIKNGVRIGGAFPDHGDHVHGAL